MARNEIINKYILTVGRGAPTGQLCKRLNETSKRLLNW